MNWIIFFLTDLKLNLEYVLPVIVVLAVTGLVGSVFFRFFVNNKKLSVIIPAGMVAGPALFILYLGVFSYPLKGRLGILLIFLIFIFSGVYIYTRFKKTLSFEFPKRNLGNLILAFLALIVIFVAFVKAGNAAWGGDAITYWGFATSFSNGNYPMVLPWQPQFLTVHHQGAFLFEGALHALTGVDIRVVHFIFAAFIILAGFFLLWGHLAYQTSRPFISIAPSIFGYVTFGGFFIILLKRFFPLSSQITISDLPILSNAKDALGALSSVPELYYLIPRTVDIAIIILMFVIIVEKFKGDVVGKFSVISTLLVVLLSTDESMFAGIILPAAIWVLYGLIKSNKKEVYFKGLVISGLIFAVLFWVVGNPIRDSILTPSPVAPRFRIVDLTDIVNQKRVAFLDSYSIISATTPNLIWYLPDFRILLGGFILLAFVLGDPLSILLSLAALGSTILYFFIDHTFWPGNYARFLLTGYQFVGFLGGVLVVKLLTGESKIRKLVGILILLIVIPGSVASFLSLSKSLVSQDSHYSNFSPLTTHYKVLDWIKGNLPYNSRIFFIDGFLYGAPYSDLTLQAIQGYGLFVPISSAKYKMHTAEYGEEAVDLITTLSPQAMADLHVQYLYIKAGQLSNYSRERQRDIANSDFFTPAYEDEKGVLYKVSSKYFSLVKIEKNTLAHLGQLIPKNSRIYIDSVPGINYYIRSATLLALKDRGKLYTVWGPGHYNYVETFINISDPSLSEGYDYLVLGPKTNPFSVCKCRNVKKIWENSNAIGYKILR